MTVTIMIDGSIKRNRKFSFKLQSSHVIEKRYNLAVFVFVVVVVVVLLLFCFSFGFQAVKIVLLLVHLLRISFVKI